MKHYISTIALILFCHICTPMDQAAYEIISIQNKRETQEDRTTYYRIKNELKKTNGHFFAVYDGHRGEQAANALSAKLHTSFEQHLHSTNDIKKAFELSFEQTEKEILLDQHEAGSTAVALYLDIMTKKLHYAWVGDSRLVIESNGSVAAETSDHKPGYGEEKKRIQDRGGFVEKLIGDVPRVNGDLAISRAFGDKSLKLESPGLIAEPEYNCISLNENNHFFIMATDGLWDDVSSKEAVDSTYTMLTDDVTCSILQHMHQLIGSHNRTLAIAALIWKAQTRGSSDNISIILSDIQQLLNS